MEQKTITADNIDDNRLRQLYETAFPEEEQIPWQDLMRLIGEMHLDFTAYYDGDTFIGFTVVYPRRRYGSKRSMGYNWFWYFAVSEELRGQGYGQQILTLIKERYKDQPSVFDMESLRQECDNIVQRRRRHAFYLRNGFRDTNIYRNYDDIEMTMMMIGPGEFTVQDWDDIVRDLRQYWTCEEK